jgi:hypothetical protein
VPKKSTKESVNILFREILLGAALLPKTLSLFPDHLLAVLFPVSEAPQLVQKCEFGLTGFPH